MRNLLKMESFHLLHSFIFRCGLAVMFLTGFFMADAYLFSDIKAPTAGEAAGLADIFNRMVYDSVMPLIAVSVLLSLILGQEFSSRTVSLEISAGHSRKEVFACKIIAYLTAFNFMAVLYPTAGCIRESVRFPTDLTVSFFYSAAKAAAYSFLLNSASFLTAILICYYLRNAARAAAVTAAVTFVLSCYLGYGMMLQLPVAFLPSWQIRKAVGMPGLLYPPAILTGILWICVLLLLSWSVFRRCELR